MTEPIEPSSGMQASSASAGGVIDVQSRWMNDDDLALGFECADPSLQIERWGQDDGQAKRGFFA